jgi:hypothetical protein
MSAKPMRRLSGRIAIFERIYKNPIANFFELITRPLIVPVLLLDELLVQIFFRAQNALIIRLNYHHFGLKVEDDALKLYRNLVDFGFLACVRKSPRCAGYRLEKSKGGGKFDCHNAGINPQIPRQVNK